LTGSRRVPLPNHPSPNELEPTLAAGALSLSGAALLELVRPVLDKGLPVRFQAKGFSMSPFIRDGDVITLLPFARRPPALGDVAAYLQPASGRLVVHRLVDRTSSGWLIQGDNAPSGLDGPVPAGELLARVARVERQGRRVWLGLGLESRVIAYLSRTSRLTPWLARLMLFKGAIFRPFTPPSPKS